MYGADMCVADAEIRKYREKIRVPCEKIRFLLEKAAAPFDNGAAEMVN